MSECSIDSDFPHDNHHCHIHNLGITFDCQETGPIEQLRPVVNKTSLLVSVMVEQPIIKAAISSVDTFHGTITKFELGIASVENAAQISWQDILCIAFSKIVGSPFSSAHR